MNERAFILLYTRVSLLNEPRAVQNNLQHARIYKGGYICVHLFRYISHPIALLWSPTFQFIQYHSYKRTYVVYKISYAGV